MNTTLQKIETVTAKLPPEEREAYVAGLANQAEEYTRTWLAEEEARVAHTRRALDQVARGDTMTMSEARADMEQFIASRKK